MDNWAVTIAVFAGLSTISHFIFDIIKTIISKSNKNDNDSENDSYKDHFFKYYIITALCTITLLWVFLKFCSPDNQFIVVIFLFVLLLILSIVSVAWRYNTVKTYLISPEEALIHTDFFRIKTYYWNYYLLIGPAIILIFAMIISFTSDEATRSNQKPLLLSFCVLLVCLSFCRFLWHWIDIWAIRKCRRDNPGILKKYIR